MPEGKDLEMYVQPVDGTDAAVSGGMPASTEDERLVVITSYELDAPGDVADTRMPGNLGLSPLSMLRRRVVLEYMKDESKSTPPAGE